MKCLRLQTLHVVLFLRVSQLILRHLELVIVNVGYELVLVVE